MPDPSALAGNVAASLSTGASSLDRRGEIALAIPAALAIQAARGVSGQKKGELKEIKGQLSRGDGFISINGYCYTNGYAALYYDLRE